MQVPIAGLLEPTELSDEMSFLCFAQFASHRHARCRRRHPPPPECEDCERRFTTYERVAPLRLMVVKRDARASRLTATRS